MENDAPTPAASLDGTREEFEKWAASQKFTLALIEDIPEAYCSPTTLAAWFGWQASRSSERERAAELEKNNEFLKLQMPMRHKWVMLCERLELSANVPVATISDRLRAAESRVEELQRELAQYLEAIADVHAVLDAAGIPKAGGKPCGDPKCQSHIGHRTRALASQLSKLTELLRLELAAWDVVAARYPPPNDHPIGTLWSEWHEMKKAAAALRSHIDRATSPTEKDKT